MKNIGIIDLGINNIKSINNASKLYGNTYLIKNINQFQENSDLIILPGNGNFKAGMEIIKKNKIDDLINHVIKKNVKLITICLGIQLLMENSEESPGTNGLSIIEGSCLKVDSNKFKTPLLGWYDVQFNNKEKKSFFFNNNYMIKPQDKSIIKGSIHNEIVSYVELKNIYGFQFHPEKSGNQGLKLLKRVIDK
jgi:glutamine amidotransferase